ncbi:hypothetical protein [Nitrososphaera sp. AFS]|nr:hypothetical protein [Nitrososphaera sp. AFS]
MITDDYMIPASSAHRIVGETSAELAIPKPSGFLKQTSQNQALLT